MSGAKLQQEILAFMEAGLPNERIFRRRDFDRFGPTEDVDRALDRLARARKIGSPANGVWFPIHFAAGLEQPIPYASLRRLALSLLHREGVTTCTSRQERDHRLFHETDGREGEWGVPNFEAIGVEQPVYLSLLWNQGGAYTEHQGDPVEHADDCGFTATEIHDPQKLRRRAEQLDLVPARIEKDVWVNAALKGFGSAPWPSGGCLLFAGGTSLVKTWELSPRFSEDVDFWYLDQGYPPDPSEAKKESVHAHLLQTLQQWVLPSISDATLNFDKSAYRLGSPVQRAFVDYPSVVEDGHTGTLKIEVMFTRSVPGWEAQSVYAFPALTYGPAEELVSRFPCVATWATMQGKLHALTLMHPGKDFQDMRHVHDLGVWMRRTPSKHHYPRMVRQGFVDGVMRNLLDGLLPALATLADSEACHRAYRRYIVDMYPSSRRGDAPDWDSAVRSVRRLWEEMCASDWENPDYEPGPVDLPMEADFKDPASQTADSAELSAQTKAMRAATEKARDAEAESYADYWRKRSTRER